MTGAEALRTGVERLRGAEVPDPARDARALLAHAAGIAPDRLSLHLNDPLPPEALTRYEAALAARASRQPVSQIIGHRLFWGRIFRVTRDVLDPRPETETLIAAALERPFQRVVDLGTGSGAILLTLLAERVDATGIATDLSEPALAVARDNALVLGLSARADFVLSDWWQAIEGRFDLIVSNPPYIAVDEMAGLSPEVHDWEPHLALTPGGDGLDAYRAIIAGAGVALAPAGRLLLEIGPAQGHAVVSLCKAAGLASVTILSDLDGRDRVVSACAHGTATQHQA